MSTLPSERLPTNLQTQGAERLCEVSSVLKNQEVGRAIFLFNDMLRHVNKD